MVSTPLLDGLANLIWQQIKSKSDRDLEKIISESYKLTKTNCSWRTYLLAPAAKDFAKTIKFYREMRK